MAGFDIDYPDLPDLVTLEVNPESALDRKPIDFPYGFIIEDNFAGGSSYPFWYSSEGEVLSALQLHLLSFLSEDDHQTAEDIKTVFTDPIVSQQLWDTLNDLLNDADAEIRIGWFGTFKRLCEGQDDFEKSIRKQFWRTAEEYEDDERTEPFTNINSSITTENINEFAEWLESYGQ